jgi:predicted small lipoprotein YifL
MAPTNQFSTPTVLCLSLILTFITHLTPIVSFLPDSKKDTQHKGQTEKRKKGQRFTKHYTEN